MKGKKFDEELINIDKNILDDEWINQPKLYLHWAEQFEDAKNTLREVETELGLTKAEIELDIRQNPDNYELSKVTEGAISATLVLQPSYKQAQEVVLTTKHRVGILQQVIIALDHRKKALENLVSLYGREYFAVPQAKNEHSREAVEEIEKRSTRARIKKTLKKKK